MAKQKEDKQTEFVNPFTPSLSYNDWPNTVPSGVNMKEYFTSGGLSESEVNHIINELEIIKNE